MIETWSLYLKQHFAFLAYVLLFRKTSAKLEE